MLLHGWCLISWSAPGTLSSHLPTFSLIAEDPAYQPGFPHAGISVTCLLLFCGNSLRRLSSWPLDEPVYSSSHSRADKLLWATRAEGNSQHFLLVFLVGCAAYGLELACTGLCLLPLLLALPRQKHVVFLSGHKIGLCCPPG